MCRPKRPLKVKLTKHCAVLGCEVAHSTHKKIMFNQGSRSHQFHCGLAQCNGVLAKILLVKDGAMPTILDKRTNMQFVNMHCSSKSVFT